MRTEYQFTRYNLCAEFDNKFEMEGAVFPSLGDGSQGGNILGISKEAEANLRPHANIDDDRFENTWKIDSQDIKCKVKDKKPVILGEGELPAPKAVNISEGRPSQVMPNVGIDCVKLFLLHKGLCMLDVCTGPYKNRAEFLSEYSYITSFFKGHRVLRATCTSCRRLWESIRRSP